MDTIRYWIENKPEALLRAIQKVDILFVNDEECRLIAQELNLVRRAQAPGGWTQGYCGQERRTRGHALREKFCLRGGGQSCERVVDPTGAGDAFAGAFLGYLDSTGRFNQRELRKAAVYGNVVASLVIEDFGVDGLLRASQLDIINRYQQFRKLCAF